MGLNRCHLFDGSWMVHGPPTCQCFRWHQALYRLLDWNLEVSHRILHSDTLVIQIAITLNHRYSNLCSKRKDKGTERFIELNYDLLN